MLKKKWYFVFLGVTFTFSLIIFFVLFHKHSLQADLAQKKETIGNVSDVFNAELSNTIENFKAKIQAVKTLVSDIRKGIAQEHYFTSDTISLLTTEKDGILLPFSYASHGNTSQGFKGFSSKIVISNFPENWTEALKKAFNDIGLADFLFISPSQEGLLKVLLLIKDRFQSVITIPEFLLETTLLMSRFAFTPGFESFSKASYSISPVLASAFQAITFKGKKAIDFLDMYYGLLHKALTRKFPKKMINGVMVDDSTYIPNGSLIGDAEARSVLFSLFVRSSLFYAEIKNMFDASEQGKKLSHQLYIAPQNSRKQFLTEYNGALPRYKELVGFIVLELSKLFKRLKNQTYKTTLEAMFEPFFNGLGLSFSDLEKSLMREIPSPEPPSMGSAEMAIADLDVTLFDIDSF